MMVLRLILEIIRFIIVLSFIWAKSVVKFFRTLISPYKKDVTNDVVVITGAGSGLGQLMCIRFAELGSIVVGWDINEAGLKATKELVREKTGHEIKTFVCDVSEPDAVYDTAKRTRDSTNSAISIFINNAGIVTGKLLLEMPDPLIEKVFKVNAISHFWTTKAVLPEMMSRRKGHLVFIASCAGIFGAKRLTEYCASKAADMLFAESLLSELQFGGHPEIKVTCVCPWFITTGMFAGCKSEFPEIMPNLEPSATVDTIVAGILREQEVLVIPRIVYLLNFLKSVLSTQATVELYRAAGAHRFMDRFEGRAAKLD